MSTNFGTKLIVGLIVYYVACFLIGKSLGYYP